LVGAGFVAVLWLGVQLWRPVGSEEGEGVPVNEPVLAVLPFEDHSPAGDQAWFVDGLHEELLDQLGMLRGIRLTASTSLSHFRESPASVSSIADSLGARFVLEGSVRRAEDSVNVTVRLNDAGSGDQLWSDSFNRAMSLEGLFDLQSSIANRVAGSVGGTLAAGAGQVIGSAPTSNLEAYHAYLLGLHHFGRVRIFPAVDALNRAVELDPEFGQAHGKLARIYAGINNGAGGTGGELFPLMREHARAAMRYAPDDPESHLAMGAVYWTIEWDWEAARQEAEAALTLDPDHVDVIGALAEWHAAIAANSDLALEILQRADRIDPFSSVTLMVRGSVLTYARRHREAVEVFRRLVALAGDDWWWRWWLATSLVRADEREEARAVLAELMPVVPSPTPVDMALPLAGAGETATARQVLDEAVAPKNAGGSVAASSISLGYAALGEVEEALTWLELSFEQEGGTYMLRHPDWDPLRHHPRFQRLWDRLGLPESGPEN
jgi:TolB-like protein